ncbi:hypothetical protein SESBI_06169 [Sesbania bispinosa]|nr:hypothetical protein SESBI_06169 [Sesbania bispinosa]
MVACHSAATVISSPVDNHVDHSIEEVLSSPLFANVFYSAGQEAASPPTAVSPPSRILRTNRYAEFLEETTVSTASPPVRVSHLGGDLEILITKDPLFRALRLRQPRLELRMDVYRYRYWRPPWGRRVRGHDTEECWDLMNQIEQLINDGYLKKYVSGRGKPDYARTGGRGRGRSYPTQMRPKVQESNTEHEEEIRGTMTMIVGGFIGGGSTSSARRRYCRLAGQVNTVDTDEMEHPHFPAITFSDDDFKGIQPHEHDPMDSVEVRGYVELLTSFGMKLNSKAVRVKYLVVNAPSSYNAILGRAALDALGGSGVDYSLDDEVPFIQWKHWSGQGRLGGGEKVYRNSLRLKRGEWVEVAEDSPQKDWFDAAGGLECTVD